ncbi:hypothetical protein [Paracoccus sp. (in: a-proteobacteria)]|uniref:hypothetical protein n=1 Tax=Paracoccus sp. TaxID=267 RepID=UPI0026E007AA|nr:hypothetical protein [Paracoccus sp. (in: a-proteobacteria)]MDO5647147.1 hypothetical protein [Paracoccus sp. (in: a-proteobacteria)]
MKTIGIIFASVMTLAVAGCGQNVAERTITGGTAGAVVAGPVGAVAGATAGATGAVRVNTR